jgi:hypothetical protein
MRATDGRLPHLVNVVIVFFSPRRRCPALFRTTWRAAATRSILCPLLRGTARASARARTVSRCGPPAPLTTAAAAAIATAHNANLFTLTARGAARLCAACPQLSCCSGEKQPLFVGGVVDGPYTARDALLAASRFVLVCVFYFFAGFVTRHHRRVPAGVLRRRRRPVPVRVQSRHRVQRGGPQHAGQGPRGRSHCRACACATCVCVCAFL